MKVAVTGGLGAIGRQGVQALVAEGHDVVALSGSTSSDTELVAMGAEPCRADIFDVDSLVRLLDGCDAVVNLPARLPISARQALPWAWRFVDRVRTLGTANVVAAAVRAGVRRVVQDSASLVYAPGGDSWITEESPIEITAATEPLAVAESEIQDFSGGPRVGVVLRFGRMIGADGTTELLVRSGRHLRAVGVGRPEAWVHVVHPDDVATALVSALYAPSGIFNVGAAPVRSSELSAGMASAVGLPHVTIGSPLVSMLAGQRLEPLTRSLRICSDHFSAQTGWSPRHPEFGIEWLSSRERTSR